MDIREVVYRNELTGLLLQKGWNVFLPVIDQGIDLIAYREGDGHLRLIQQKSRWTIDRKYIGRRIEVAFPHTGMWFVVPHDAMLEWPEVRKKLATRSWTERGQYSTARPSAALLARLSGYQLTA